MGGMLIKPGEPYYEMLKTWITQGAAFDADAPRVAKIEVSPSAPIIPLPKMKQQFRVMATYSDGSQRDVSGEAFVESGNIEVLEADKHGLITALRRGESAVLIRYEGNYAAATVTVMGDRSGFVWKDQPENNYIDELVDAKLKRVRTFGKWPMHRRRFHPPHLSRSDRPAAKLSRSPRVSGRFAEMRVKRDELDRSPDRQRRVCRAYEHQMGRSAAVQRQVSGRKGSPGIAQLDSPGRRHEHAIRQIRVCRADGQRIEHREPARFVLQDSSRSGPADGEQHATFPRRAIQLQQLPRSSVRALDAKPALAAGGVSSPMSPAKTIRIMPTRKSAATTSKEPRRLAKSSTTRRPASKSAIRRRKPCKRPPSHTRIPTWTPAVARFASNLPAGPSSPKNPYFAKSYVNRPLELSDGRRLHRAGRRHPRRQSADQSRIARPHDGRFHRQRIRRAKAPAADLQVGHVSAIARNADKWNNDDTINYSHAIARRLPAEVLYDAVFQVTGATRQLSGMPTGARAAEEPDPSVNSPDGFLDLFGRAPRQSSCECERFTGVMLGQALNLINGPTVADAINQPEQQS